MQNQTKTSCYTISNAVNANTKIKTKVENNNMSVVSFLYKYTCYGGGAVVVVAVDFFSF